MKREFVKATIPNITDDQLDAIMNEHGKTTNALRSTITTHEATIQTLTTERDGYKGQVAERDKDIKTLRDEAKTNGDINQRLSDLQTKYNTDTKALQKKLDDQRNDHATERFFSGVEFTSTLAKNAAIADFRAKGFKLKDDGTYEGADTYLEQLKKENPAAFKAAEEDKDDKKDDGQGNPNGNPFGNGQQYRPRFTHQMTNGGKTGNGDDKAMPLNFHFVRNPPKQE